MIIGHCSDCLYWQFLSQTPFSGECRRNPPRSFLEGRDAKPGRFFVHARHDDWCGQYKKNEDEARLREIEEATASYKSPDSKVELANKFKRSKRLDDAIRLYEGIYESGYSNSQIAFELADCYRQRDRGPCRNAFEWLLKSSDSGHAEAPYFIGLYYVQGGMVDPDIEKANEYLTLSAERGFGRAKNKLDDGGFVIKDSVL